MCTVASQTGRLKVNGPMYHGLTTCPRTWQKCQCHGNQLGRGTTTDSLLPSRPVTGKALALVSASRVGSGAGALGSGDGGSAPTRTWATLAAPLVCSWATPSTTSACPMSVPLSSKAYAVVAGSSSPLAAWARVTLSVML